VKADLLVDTSVWIDVYRGKDPALTQQVATWAKSLRLSTCGLVLTELLRGARTEPEYRQLVGDLGALDFLESTPEVFLKAAELSFALRRKGHIVGLADAVIAATALVYKQQVLTRDKEFAKIPSLKITLL
jgi:predicted nucleic acid-binding protein